MATMGLFQRFAKDLDGHNGFVLAFWRWGCGLFEDPRSTMSCDDFAMVQKTKALDLLG